MKIKRYAKWLLCCQLTSALAICVLLRKDDSFLLLLLLVPLLSESFFACTWYAIQKIMRSCRKLPTTKVASASEIACMRLCTSFSCEFFSSSLFWLRSHHFFFKLDIFKRQSTHSMSNGSTAHGSHSYNTCMLFQICSFGSHARTVIIMWWFHNIFKLAHTRNVLMPLTGHAHTLADIL